MSRIHAGGGHGSRAATPVRPLPGMAPPWIALPAFLCLLFLVVPFAGIILGANWRAFPELLVSQASVDALRLSAQTTTVSTVVSLVFGVPLAYWLAVGADGSPLGRAWTKVVRTMVSLPIVLPPVVAGLALLLVFGRRGLLGSRLSAWGVEIGFTPVAVVMAQVFVAMPYLVVSLEGALRTRGFELEQTAYQLGASRTRVLWSITLPLSAPAITSGIALTFSRALGEFGATLTFAGSLQGTTRTLPLEIYLQRESDSQSALSLAIVLTVVACTVVGGAIFLTGRWQMRLFPTHVLPDVDSPSTSFPPGDPVRRTRPAPGIQVNAAVVGRGVELRVDMAPGVVTAVVGPNGSGKSTMLGLISGSVTPSEGGAAFVGADATKRLATVTQRSLLFPHMSVLDNVRFGLRARGVDKDDCTIRAERELQGLGIGHLAGRRAGQLSGGQAQRVAIARAMALDPDVLLLDEPMAALDAPVAARLRIELSRRLRSSGITVVLTTHDPADVAALAQDLVVLDGGHVVCSGPWRQVFSGCDNSFVLGLTNRFTVRRGDTRLVVSPLDLRIAREGEAGIPVQVHGHTWAPWGPAVVGLTQDGDLVSFAIPASQEETVHVGDVVMLTVDGSRPR